VVAVADGTGRPVLVVDVGRRLPGRGAWLHPDPGCLEQAERRRAFGRALRLSVSPDVSAVRQHVAGLQEQGASGSDPGAIVDRESGLEADGCPMSAHR